MAIAIDVQGLSKKYRLGEYHAAYGTLRESLVACGEAARPGRSTTGRHQEIWALDDVSFEVPEGQVLGRHRPQRRGEVDAAQDPDPDHDADRRDGPRSAAASEACSRSGRASTRS